MKGIFKQGSIVLFTCAALFGLPQQAHAEESALQSTSTSGFENLDNNLKKSHSKHNKPTPSRPAARPAPAPTVTPPTDTTPMPTLVSDKNIPVQGPVGPQGEPGPAGSAGPAGPQGIQGLQGIQGVPGLVGPAGPQGMQGDKGDKGDKGAKGPQGNQGNQGDKGEPGEKITQACAYYYSNMNENILPGKGYGLVEFQTNKEATPDSFKAHHNINYGGFGEITEIRSNEKGEQETFVAAIQVPYTGLYKVSTMISSQSAKNTFALVKNIGEITSNPSADNFTPGFVTEFTLINGGISTSTKPRAVTNQGIVHLQEKDTLSIISLDQVNGAMIGKLLDPVIEQQGIDGPIAASIVIELITILE